MAKTVNMGKILPVLSGTTVGKSGKVLEEELFQHVLSRERKRSERSGEYMLLLTIDVARVEKGAGREQVLALMAGRVSRAIRDTDACGWLKEDELLGIVFTGIPADAILQARQTVEQKIGEFLVEGIAPSLCERVGLSIFVFPGEISGKEEGGGFNPLFYPEILQKDAATRIADLAKRAMDIIGSIAALVLFSPFFIIIPLLIKITSPGPVLFRQARLGQFGRPFTFLKFRSMRVNSEDSIHREFIRDFIANKMGADAKTETGETVFKIRNDPRITTIGAFLRKSSLDELPQFINVLRGEMSLVGPRPPIPYELKDYGVWHRYRIFARKPGITGLWQVRGRSLTTFDGMVRLDLQYIRNWSLWLDIKLLFATPIAVLRGKGAY